MAITLNLNSGKGTQNYTVPTAQASGNLQYGNITPQTFSQQQQSYVAPTITPQGQPMIKPSRTAKDSQTQTLDASMLSEEQRNKLIGLIKTMKTNGYSDQDQSIVVKNFVAENATIPEKKPGFIQSLVRGIANVPARLGVEAYNVATALNPLSKQSVSERAAELDKPRDLGYLGTVSPTLTNSTKPGIKQALDVAGQGAEAASFFLGGGEAKGLVKAGEQGIKQLGIQGMKTGAIVGGTGAFGNSLQGENQSIGKTLLQTGEGILGGGILGFATGAGAGLLKGMPWSTAPKEAKDAWKMIQPNLTPTEQAKAVTQGKIQTKGMLGTITQVPKGRDLQMIEAATPYVSGAKNEIEAVANMQSGIEKEAIALRQGLKNTGATYTKSQLKGAFAKIESDPNLISDPILAKKAQLLQTKALEFAGNGGTLDKLQDVNTKLDKYIAQYYPNLYNSDALTPLRQAVRETRNAIKDTIASRLPKGGEAYRAALERQTLLYDAIENVASKTPKVGTNIMSRWIKANPIKAKIGGTLLGATALGGVAKETGILP